MVVQACILVHQNGPLVCVSVTHSGKKDRGLYVELIDPLVQRGFAGLPHLLISKLLLPLLANPVQQPVWGLKRDIWSTGTSVNWMQSYEHMPQPGGSFQQVADTTTRLLLSTGSKYPVQ